MKRLSSGPPNYRIAQPLGLWPNGWACHGWYICLPAQINKNLNISRESSLFNQWRLSSLANERDNDRCDRLRLLGAEPAAPVLRISRVMIGTDKC